MLFRCGRWSPEKPGDATLGLLFVLLTLHLAACRERGREEARAAASPVVGEVVEPVGLVAAIPRPDPVAIDPGAEWLLERFADAAHPRMLAILDGREALPASATARGLRPELSEAAVVGDIRILRGGGPGVEVPREDLVGGLFAPFRGGAPAHRKTKIVRVTQQDGGEIEAAIVYEADGLSVSGGLVQQRARWKSRWKWSDGEEAELRWVEPVDFEECHRAAATPLFAERTRDVVGGLAAWETQLRFGVDDWLQRIEMFHGSFLGARCGLAVGDVDGDGFDDLYLCQPSGVPNRLLLRAGDGGVRDVSVEAGLDWLDYTTAALIVDLDNDGDQDLALATNAGVVVLEQAAPLRFERRALLQAADTDVESLSAADYDLDGDLDLYLCFDYGTPGARPDEPGGSTILHDSNDGGANVLFENRLSAETAFRFEDVTVRVGLDVANRRHSIAAAWEDYDGDGDMDLYVANDYGKNCLYRNDFDAASGACRFAEVAAASGVEDTGPGMSVSWADYDNDGDADLYVGNMFSSAGGRIFTQPNFRSWLDEESRALYRRFVKGNSMFENLGDGTFREVGEPLGVEPGRWAWSSVFGDLNSDGWEDIVVANGYITTGDTGDL
ncbi:MAG: FG-GAP repeat domain-containing protein [Verrucomicrobiales bacterium]